MNFIKKIDQLKKVNRYRKSRILQSVNSEVITVEQKKLINFGSNNYLNLAESSKVKKAFVATAKKWGVGSGASRLVTGTLQIHHDLERKLAEFSKKDDAMIFTSGYMANLGLISALVSKKDLVILDKIDHASIIDGARLSQANVRIFPHQNLNYLENILKKSDRFENKIIVVDSVFSMDGDISNLRKLIDLKKKYGALLAVDEAHAVGVFGENGCGLADELGFISDVDFKIGTLSKAFGLQGGYIASSFEAIDFLRNSCRSYIYTTSIAPAICGAALEVIEIFKSYQKERKDLRKKFSWFTQELNKLGVDTLKTMSQIIPLVIGDEKKVLQFEKKLMNKGFFVPAIRYPTVKQGTERFRISIIKNHSMEQLSDFLEVLKAMI